MKKNLVSILFLLLTISALSQDKRKDKDFYLQKSKHQKTAFYIFASTGTALVLTGIILSAAHNDPDTQYFTGGFIAAGGFGALAISVPFFIGSQKIKRKAMSLSFKNEPAQQIYKNSMVYRSIPSLTLKLHL